MLALGILAGALLASKAQVISLVAVTTASSVSLNSSPNPSAFQGTATFTAIVSGDAPTGTVTFMVDTSALCSPAPVASNGTATCTQMFPYVGSYSITAVYSGDATNSGATSPTFVQEVDRAPGYSFVMTPCRGGMPIEGQPYSFLALELGYGATTFTTTTGKILCQSVPMGEGFAVCEASSFGTVGIDPTEDIGVVATYSGDLNYLPGVSQPFPITIVAASESIFRGHFEGFDELCPVSSPF